jgi:hypothetical protein
LPEDYRRSTYRLLVDQSLPAVDIATRAPSGLTSVTFKLVDKSRSRSKIYVDDIRVYLYGGEFESGIGRAAEGTRGLPLLPPPPIPDGFRGTN